MVVLVSSFFLEHSRAVPVPSLQSRRQGEPAARMEPADLPERAEPQSDTQSSAAVALPHYLVLPP